MALQTECLTHLKYMYIALEVKFPFVSVVVEMSCVFVSDVHEFLHELGSCMTRISLKPKSFQYLVQRISVAVHRSNAAAVLGTFAKESDLDVLSVYE